MSQPKYTFILTAYRGRFLDQAIRSILGQTLPDFCLVIVNDASLDDIDGIVKAFDDHRISYISLETNCGGKDLAHHWNNCLRYATSEYVILASDDDLYDPGFLSEIDRLTIAYPTADVIAARSRFIDADGNVTHTAPPVTEYMTCAQYTAAYCDEQIISSLQNHVFRRSALSAAGGLVEFPLAWHTDDATVLALSMGGVAYSTMPLFSFRNSGDNISSARPDKQMYMLKFEARARLWHWFVDVHIPRIATLYPDIDTATTMRRLQAKLKRLSLSMLFFADMHTAWRVRSGFISQPFVTVLDYYSFMAGKIWNNYKFIFNIKRWPRLIRNMAMLKTSISPNGR